MEQKSFDHKRDEQKWVRISMLIQISQRLCEFLFSVSEWFFTWLPAWNRFLNLENISVKEWFSLIFWRLEIVFLNIPRKWNFITWLLHVLYIQYMCRDIDNNFLVLMPYVISNAPGLRSFKTSSSYIDLWHRAEDVSLNHVQKWCWRFSVML